ncbi:MAG: hypothetical protein ACREIP_00850 [Alphaproteobacteria bacterium]
MKQSALAILALCVTAAPAAADFTFKVPVEIRDAPAVDQFRVECQVARTLHDGRPNRQTTVARGASRYTRITNGEYSGTLTIEAKGGGFYGASEGRYWICVLEVQGRTRTGGRFSTRWDLFETIYREATGGTIKEATYSVQGEVTR